VGAGELRDLWLLGNLIGFKLDINLAGISISVSMSLHGEMPLVSRLWMQKGGGANLNPKL